MPAILPFTSMQQAARRLRRSPGYTASVIAVLALCIGAVTAIFSVVYSVLLAPYGFEEKGQLAVWHETIREMSATMPLAPVNYRHFLNLQTPARSLEAAALVRPSGQSVSVGNGHPEMVPGLDVSQDFFRVLGSAPAIGRTFRPEEFRKGRDHEAVLSWAAYQRFFAGDPNVLRKTLRVNGVPLTIVGVLPASFRMPAVSIMPGESASNAKAYAVYTPLIPQPVELTENTNDFNYFGLARLRPGVSVQAAQSELDGIEKATAAADHLPIHLGVVMEPFAQEITGTVSKSLVLLLLAVGGVLLIGCVNLANLQLARSVGHAGEQALRAALGASRGQLVREALAENLLLACAGGLAAVGVAYGGVHLLLALAPAGLPRLEQVRLSLPVLGVAAALSLATSLAFGLLPAWRAGAADPLRAMGNGSSRTAGESRGAARTRTTLLVAEIACSLVLLTITGLVARSFGHLLTSARGLSQAPVTMAEASLSDPRYQGEGDFTADGNDAPSRARDAMIDRTLAKLQALPGVRTAAITSTLPLTGDINVDAVRRPDNPLSQGETQLANLRMISPGYFAALGIPIASGRDFTAADRNHARVVIVSEKTARAVWPGENPVGHTIEKWDRVYTVVGISADARLNDPRRDVAMFYIPFWDYPPFSPVFLVRGSGIAGPEIRQAIWSVDPEVAIPTLLPLRVQTNAALAVERFQTLLVGAFGLAGLLLAALGVYGVIGHGVNLRMREWGVRMALGSSRGQLLCRVLLDAGRPALAGAVLGVVGALAAGRWLASLLYGAKTSDVPVMVGAVLLLGVAVLLAALPAARRAAAVEPAAILRGE